MWAGSDVGGLFAENMGLFAENVGLKYRPFAQNVSRTKGIFVGLRDYVCGPLQLTVGLFTLLANHHDISQPSTTFWRLASSSWYLLGHVSHRARWPAPLMSKGS